MAYQDLTPSIYAWICASLFVVPRRPGLTREEIEAIALEAGHGRGEIQDALGELLDRFQNVGIDDDGRYWFPTDSENRPPPPSELIYFSVRNKNEPRNVRAFDLLYEYFAEVAKHRGKESSIAGESEILAAGAARGLSEHDMLVAIGAVATEPRLLRREGDAWRASPSWFTGDKPSSPPRNAWQTNQAEYIATIPLIRAVLTRRGATAPTDKGATSMSVQQMDDIRSVAIMFLDAVGWSKLEAADIKKFVTQMLPKINVHLSSALNRNTWGDAVVATFAHDTEAANAALNIRDLFHAAGDDILPRGLSVRIALHHGQVMHLHNAVRDSKDIFGHAVHVAARLEPVTAPGQVFCTAEVANALRDLRGMGPRAHPVGKINLPKGFGTLEAFVVTRNNEPVPHVTFDLPTYSTEETKKP